MILERFWDVSLQGRLFYRIVMILEVVWTGKIKQNHGNVIKNQGFAEASQIWCGSRSFIDFEVTLGCFGHRFGAPERFLREKIASQTTSEI